MIPNALNPIQGAGCPRSGYDYLRNSYSKYVENQNLTKILFDIVFQILRRFFCVHNRYKDSRRVQGRGYFETNIYKGALPINKNPARLRGE